MSKTPISELERKPTPEPELKKPRKPEPELEQPRKPEPEIKQPVPPVKPEVGDDQGDSGPDKDNPITQDSERPSTGATLDPQDAHIGATEGQESDTPAPSGPAYKDEPKQG
jgi:hypothetical protein